MGTILIRNGMLVNRGSMRQQDIFIRDDRIELIAGQIDRDAHIELDAAGKYVLPGIIDDQVHFREPGLTHKADIFSESRAAVAGGVTSFMEMPNTNPPAVTQALLAEKYATGAQRSLANYSFYMGGSNQNLDELLKTDPRTVCGLKLFMGSSTGNMLVDDPDTLDAIFSRSHMLIATHCEDETTIRNNMASYQARYGDDIPPAFHPLIRSAEACYLSSSMAVEKAKKYGTRLHILHLSTDVETGLFEADIPLAQKKISAEVCVHHLHFSEADYAGLGNQIKCNPAIKRAEDRQALWKALLDDRLDVIATDHAPHTWEEKQQLYAKAPSGLPLVQHSLNLMLHYVEAGAITLEKVVEKMCHAPAVCFRMPDRGFIDQGYKADLVILDPDMRWEINRENILYKCGWSPLEGMSCKGYIESTIVSGHLAWHNGQLNESRMGERLSFDPL